MSVFLNFFLLVYICKSYSCQSYIYYLLLKSLDRYFINSSIIGYFGLYSSFTVSSSFSVFDGGILLADAAAEEEDLCLEGKENVNNDV